MAGRVLRDSKGRYAGSTRGWGAGRNTHGGGFGAGRKGKTRSVAAQRRITALTKAGKTVGINAAKMAVGTGVGYGLLAVGARPSNLVVAGWAGYGAYRATKQIIRRRAASRG